MRLWNWQYQINMLSIFSPHEFALARGERLVRVPDRPKWCGERWEKRREICVVPQRWSCWSWRMLIKSWTLPITTIRTYRWHDVITLFTSTLSPMQHSGENWSWQHNEIFCESTFINRFLCLVGSYSNSRGCGHWGWISGSHDQSESFRILRQCFYLLC